MLGVFDSQGRCKSTFSSSLPFAMAAGERLQPLPDGTKPGDVWLIDGVVTPRQAWVQDLPEKPCIGSVFEIPMPESAWLRIRSADGYEVDVAPEGGKATWTATSEGSYLVEACGILSGARPLLVVSLATLRGEKWEEVKAKREAVRSSNLDVQGIGTIQADAGSRTMIDAQAARAALEGEGFTIGWTLADNTVRECTLADLQAMQCAIGARDDLCQQRSLALRAAIDAAGDQDELAAIDINAGWPGEEA